MSLALNFIYVGVYLSSCCSPSLSLTFSCPCDVSSVCVRSTPLKPPTGRTPRSRCRCRQTSWTKPCLSSGTCSPSAALCRVWALRGKTQTREVMDDNKSNRTNESTLLRTLTLCDRTGASERGHGAVAREVFDLAPQEAAVLHQVLHLPLQGGDAFLFALQHALQLGDGQQHPGGQALCMGGSWRHTHTHTGCVVFSIPVDYKTCK